MDKRQTAVEWLKELLIDNKYLSKDAEHLFEEAKSMEKEQMIDAYKQCENLYTQFECDGSQDYYTSTYGK